MLSLLPVFQKPTILKKCSETVKNKNAFWGKDLELPEEVFFLGAP